MCIIWDLLLHFANNLPSIFCHHSSSTQGRRKAGACPSYQTEWGVEGVHRGQVASLSQGQHKETNKHLHLCIHTFRQLRVAKEPKLCVLGGREEAKVPGKNPHKPQGEHAPGPPISNNQSHEIICVLG